ncbi:MAG: TetR/AcrR family transcriptional regulator [Polyangiaceae bacterium]|nr:TetR/AcrR family transcriptional regulator [Polyangiaceae bacterium]
MQPTADPRGRYDRTVSRADRARATRARLARCAAKALADPPPAAFHLVAIAAAAGVSRATIYGLYGHGPRLEKVACRWAVQAAIVSLRAAAAGAFTPIERLRALARAWCSLTEEGTGYGPLAIRLACSPGRSPMRVALAGELAAAFRLACTFGLVARPPDPTVTELVAAAWALAAAGDARDGAPPANLPERLAEMAWKMAR